MKNKDYAKIWGTNKVHYGKCESGVLIFVGLDTNCRSTKFPL